MTKVLYDILALLDNKYDIEIEEYWTLKEEDKNYLSKIISEKVIRENARDVNYIEFHSQMLEERIAEAEHQEEFERADILKRIQQKLFDYLS
jgi:hypothetical protein